MKKGRKKAARRRDADRQAHHDLRPGTRSKHAAQVAAVANIVRLDDDVAEIFDTPESVNTALRVLVRLLKELKQKNPS
jgi:hypothetical protein